MANDVQNVWLVAGLRTPFVAVDGPFAGRDSLGLSVPVVKAMARQVSGCDRLRGMGLGGRQSRLRQFGARGVARGKTRSPCADIHDHHAMQHQHGRRIRSGRNARRGRAALAMVGGVESMSRVQIGLGQNFSVWLRRMFQARSAADRLRILRRLRPSDIRLFVPEVKNRVTGRSMGEHTEDMAKEWDIGRSEQDELALEGHQRAIAAQDRGFFADLIVPAGRNRQGPLSSPRYVDGKTRQTEAGVRSDQRTRHAHGGQQLAADGWRRRHLGRQRRRRGPIAAKRCPARGWWISKWRPSISSTKVC